MILRPSVKLIVAAYAVCGMLEAAILVYWLAAPAPPETPIWVPLAVPLLLQFWAAVRHLLRLTVRLTITGDAVRYEAGLLSKTTRVMELAKVQDVRVDQRLSQRILNIGDLSLETAGETGRITMASIDRPRQAADHILELMRAGRSPDSGDGKAPQQ
jgi:membrane protein YdbS with pleckstrin-like domain